MIIRRTHRLACSLLGTQSPKEVILSMTWASMVNFPEHQKPSLTPQVPLSAQGEGQASQALSR